MNFLYSLWESLVAQDATIRAAWIGVGGALIGALVGGVLTGVATWLTTRAQLRHAATERRMERLDDLLTTIHDEVARAVAQTHFNLPANNTREGVIETWHTLWRLLLLAEARAKLDRPGLAKSLGAARRRLKARTDLQVLLAVMTLVERYLHDPGLEDELKKDDQFFDSLVDEEQQEEPAS